MKATKKDLELSIKEKCKDCTGYQREEIVECTVKKCPLWPFRLGAKTNEEFDTEIFKKKTTHKRKPMSEELKQKLKEGRQNAKEKRSIQNGSE